MKKVVLIFIGIVFFFFFTIFIMTFNNNRNLSKEKEMVIKNSSIMDIEYLNKYDNKIIVMDKENLYLFDNKYKLILEISLDKVYDNKKNYDIIYRNEKFMYMNDYLSKGKLVFEYYDIESYEFIDKVILGG